jgi:hypothetical protein
MELLTWSKRISYCISVVFFDHSLSGLFKLDIECPKWWSQPLTNSIVFIDEKVVIPSWLHGFFHHP